MSSLLAAHLAGGPCPLLKPARQSCQMKARRFFLYKHHTTRTYVRCQAGDEQNVTSTVQPTPPPMPTLPLPPPPGLPVAPAGEPMMPMPADPAVAEYIYRQQAALSQMPPAQREYYMQPPPNYPYMPPPAPVAKPAPTGGIPWWIWFGLGMVVIKFIDWVSEVMRKGPQQYMTEMAMKQMMNAMQNPSAPGSTPFGGASPFGGAAPPFPGAGGPFGASPFPFPPPQSPAQPAYDTTASTVQSSAGAYDSRPGEKFNSRLNTEGRTDMPPAGPGPAGPTLEVVEPVVKEPTSSSQTSTGPSASAFFQDVNVNDSAQPSGSPSAGASPSSNGASTPQDQQNGQDLSAVTTMMEKMLRNPEMQKMLYPYLPEPMRNPQSIEWMLNNPEVKKQMETMLAQQGFNLPPQMMDMMKNMDLSEDKVNRQFQELGLKPEDVISKVMSNPDLAAGFADPKVQQAILDITQSPMNIVKYQNDPQIMRVLEKINEIFAPTMAGQGYPGGPPPGYPGGMPPGFPGGMPPGYPGGGMPPGYPGGMPPGFPGGYPGQMPPQGNPSAPQ